MPKESTLLAQIRENAARAAKGPKSPSAPPAPGPYMAGTVETPANPNPPDNYIVRALNEECTTVAHCEELLAHAEQHGYDRSGQTVSLIKAKIAKLKKGPKAKRGAR